MTGGVYHEVQKGDTLWRIAKTYDIDLSYIIKMNNISDATKISPGDRLFIPGAKEPLKVTTDKISLFEKDYFIWPLQGDIISFFGENAYGAKNKGIDIRARRGTKVFAAKKGEVVYAGERFSGQGNIIVIDHHDGFFTVYSRNSENLVKTGEIVDHNKAIALAGSTGRGETAYLHFEIRKYGKPQNPLYYLP
ncbi:MAG: M23 family metallopeptidase [Candidatus Omnitrophica bacterium]|nr:M23 family metallopeptidase [Candidatus Omnitrophota bacterium]